MYKSLFANKKNWYKGNLHTHTTLSDGCKDPQDVIEIYQQKGYDFLALTDHRKPGKAGQYKNMLLLPGAEWDYGNNGKYAVYHILAIGTENDLDLVKYYEQRMLPCGDEIKPQEIIDRINNAGGLAFLAHPAWSVMDPQEMYDIHGFAGVEIYNSVSTTPWNAERADSSRYFDLWASKGLLIPCIAADDSHHYQGEETKSFIMVNSDELTQEGILEALKNGQFYASQGPRFEEITYDDQTVKITCSKDVERIVVYSNTVWVNQRVFDHPEGTTVYPLSPLDRYVRIELIDKDGNKAWCSPFSVR